MISRTRAFGKNWQLCHWKQCSLRDPNSLLGSSRSHPGNEAERHQQHKAPVILMNCCFQAYLSRTESASTGSITWQVDLSSCNLVIDSVTIVATSTTFQTGRVDWMLSGDDESQREKLSGGRSLYFPLHLLNRGNCF